MLPLDFIESNGPFYIQISQPTSGVHWCLAFFFFLKFYLSNVCAFFLLFAGAVCLYLLCHLSGVSHGFSTLSFSLLTSARFGQFFHVGLAQHFVIPWRTIHLFTRQFRRRCIIIARIKGPGLQPFSD